MSVFATRCDTAAAWLLSTWSSGMISVAGAAAAPALLSGSTTGRPSRAGSRWQAQVKATRTRMAACGSRRLCAAAPARRPSMRSDVQNRKALLEAFDRITSGRRIPLVRDVSGVAGGGDDVGDEPPVDFLGIVDFAAGRYARHVHVADVVQIVQHVAGQIAFHDLHVVHVVEDLEARRLHALADIESPGQTVERHIGAG